MNNHINDKEYIDLTPFKGWVLQNFPFIEADFDAITNYQLYCKIVEYLNNVISNQNQVQDLGTELVTAYNQLLDYINNYFDNLDVQEEINNKLDAMAESGELQTLIINYIKANNVINVKMYGVIGDGITDDSTKIQEIIDTYPNKTIYFPDGIYLINSTLETPTNNDEAVNIKLSPSAIIKAGAEMNYIFSLGSKKYDDYNFYETFNIPEISGGQIDCDNKSGGIYTQGYPTNIHNIDIINCKDYGIVVNYGYNANSSNNLINDVTISGKDNTGSTGIRLYGYDNKLSNILIQAFRRGVMLDGGGNILSNIHTLHHGTFNADYNSDSVGFYFVGGSYNVLDKCYSDTHASGYKFENENPQILNDCIAFWYNDLSYNNYGLVLQGLDYFNITLSNFTCNFNGNTGSRKIIYSTRTVQNGTGHITNLQTRSSEYVSDKATDYALNGYLNNIITAGSVFKAGFVSANSTATIEYPIRNAIVLVFRGGDNGLLDIITKDQWGYGNTIHLGTDTTGNVSIAISSRTLTITNSRSGSIVYYVLGQISNS